MTPADKLYAVLARLAEQGKPAPHNLSLAGMTGLPSEAAVSDAITKLTMTRRIKVEYRTTNNQRLRSFVLSNGRRTAWPQSIKRGPDLERETPDTGRVAPKLSADEMRLIEDAVAAGRVTRLQPQYQPQADDFYRRVAK